jgi:hypothetical protein
MQTNTIRAMTLLGLCIALASCAEATTVCGSGEEVRASGSSFCVYKAAIVIVGGFECPASMSFRMDFDRATVCSNHAFDNIDVPNDICARAFVPCTPIEDSDAGVTPLTCGGQICDLPNATAVCQQGSCSLATCNAGYADCDAVPGDGCETTLNTLTNCGSCGNQCATPYCQAKQCVAEPVADAGPVNIGGSCALDIFHGPEICDDGTDNDCDALVDEGCPVLGRDAGVCPAGFGDCDGQSANGCETSLKTLDNCAACGQVCVGASMTCVTGVCRVDTLP